MLSEFKNFKCIMSVILFGTGKLSNTKNKKSIFKYKLHGIISAS